MGKLRQIGRKIDKGIRKIFGKNGWLKAAATVAALTFGGKWKINDPISIKTSFPSFLKKLESLGAKFK